MLSSDDYAEHLINLQSNLSTSVSLSCCRLSSELHIIYHSYDHEFKLQRIWSNDYTKYNNSTIIICFVHKIIYINYVLYVCVFTQIS